MTKSDRWILSEFRVARDRIEHFGERLLDHRHVTRYAEVDLIFESASGGSLIIIEVKSVTHSVWAQEVISRSQKQRLERARWSIELSSKKPTRLVLATVESPKAAAALIRYFEAPF